LKRGEATAAAERSTDATIEASGATPEEPLQPVPLAQVFLAEDGDVAAALRMDGFTGEDGTGIPIGAYRAGGLDAPVYLDADFLLGPEAAHLNITGVSGLATKTSASHTGPVVPAASKKP